MNAETRTRGSLVTVGIPTFNRLEGLKRAVDSVLAQDYPDIEILISDNASTDGTELFGREFAARDERVVYRRNATNLGPTANFNLVRQAATGDFFMWLGDDDWLVPNYVSCCVGALQTDASLALVAGQPVYYRGDERERDGVTIRLTFSRPDDRVRMLFRRVVDNGAFYGVMPRRVFTSMRPLKRRVGDDWLWLAEVAMAGGIETLDDTEIRRAIGGATRSAAATAASVGLTRFEGRYPHTAIAAFAATDMAFRSKAFRPLGRRRFGLAGFTVFVILRRFVLTGPFWRRAEERARSVAIRLGVFRPKSLERTGSR